jgi:hypothetical protein
MHIRSKRTNFIIAQMNEAYGVGATKPKEKTNNKINEIN